jgi:hypothetical protein
MVTLSDRYGDLNLEDIDEFEGLEPDDEKAIDFDKTFQRGEVRSFESDFGHQLDSTLAYLESQEDPEWSDEFTANLDGTTYEREAE